MNEKIKLLRTLQNNPMSDQNTIIKLRKELEWVNTNGLSQDEMRILIN